MSELILRRPVIHYDGAYAKEIAQATVPAEARRGLRIRGQAVQFHSPKAIFDCRVDFVDYLRDPHIVLLAPMAVSEQTVAETILRMALDGWKINWTSKEIHDELQGRPSLDDLPKLLKKLRAN